MAFPRYVGLMLFISNFEFVGWALTGVHILEGFAGFALAVLEGFAISYILSRRQLGFSKADTWAIIAVTAILLILLPLCATPYLIFLFDGTTLFDVDNIFMKFIWIAATASMPVFIIVGVALVEKDPVDVTIMNAQRKAELKKTLAKLGAETEEIVLEYNLRKTQLRKDYKKPKKEVVEKKAKTEDSDWLKSIRKTNEDYDY